MISKSVKACRLTAAKAALVQTQSRAAGGGPKKPNMPATETNFDIIVVGKYRCLTLSRRPQRHRTHQVPLD